MAQQRIVIFIFLAISAFGFVANAEMKKSYTAVTDPFPPYTIVCDESFGFTGIAVDIVREAFRRSNLTLKLIERPWKRAVIEARLGEADIIFTIFQTQERMEHFLFSKEILGLSNIVLMAGANSTLNYDGSVSSLDSEIIGVPLGYNAGPILESAFTSGIAKRLDVPRAIEGLKMLRINRIKLLSDNEHVLLRLARDQGILDKVKVLNPPLSSTPFHIAYSKLLPTSASLRDTIDRQLRNMKNEGVIENIYAKYLQ